MRTIVHNGRVFYASDICKRVRTQNPRMQQIIGPCDRMPVLWQIVTQPRSAAWGILSLHYNSHTRTSDSILHRASILLDSFDRSDILGYSARFTVHYYAKPELRGGLFALCDERHTVASITLDYTPETLDEVVEQFFRFTDALPGATVTLNDKIIRRLVQLPMREEKTPCGT